MEMRRVWGASMRGRGRKSLYVGLLALLIGPTFTVADASADEWGFAWELGMVTATPQGNPFVFRLTAARSYSDELSIGPSVYLTPYGDDAMYAGSLNAEFHVALDEIRVSPFFGFGIAHRRTDHDDDTALMFPMGVSVDKEIGEELSAVGTFGLNLHGGIKLEGEKDDASVALTVGLRYGL
ncbi:MAG: hypothetical protein ACE15D_14480 [Candidatus Eisenbacteria bacterium]